MVAPQKSSRENGRGAKQFRLFVVLCQWATRRPGRRRSWSSPVCHDARVEDHDYMRWDGCGDLRGHVR